MNFNNISFELRNVVWIQLAVIRPDASTGMNNSQVFPILSAHLGTPRKVLDGGTGQVGWTWDAKQPFAWRG